VTNWTDENFCVEMPTDLRGRAKVVVTNHADDSCYEIMTTIAA
jgi:hypothetical protein